LKIYQLYITTNTARQEERGIDMENERHKERKKERVTMRETESTKLLNNTFIILIA